MAVRCVTAQGLRPAQFTAHLLEPLQQNAALDRSCITVNHSVICMHLCHYCGLKPAGSREHVPGAAALNNQAVRVVYSRMNATGNGIIHETRHEPDGFVVYTICSACNRKTGGSYGTDYKHFVQQFKESCSSAQWTERAWISIRDIHLLRVAKQLVGMFLSTQPKLGVEQYRELREFVLRRDMKLTDDALRIFLYMSSGPSARIASANGMARLFSRDREPPTIAGEVSWPPLGVVFSLGSHILFRQMRDVTDWCRGSFRMRESQQFSVPVLRVEHEWPLHFGAPAEAERWSNSVGVVWLLTVQPDVVAPTQFAAMIREYGARKPGTI